MSSNDKKMEQITVWVSKTHKMRVKTVSERTKMPMSRLVGLALDAELERNPSLDYDINLPDEYIEYAFASEAGRVLDYIKKWKGGGLSVDLVYMLRHDIGISDKDTLLGAFRELIEKEFIVELEPPKRTVFTFSDDYKCYGLPRDTKQDKEDREYKKYLKMKEKFENNKETKG